MQPWQQSQRSAQNARQAQQAAAASARVSQQMAQAGMNRRAGASGGGGGRRRGGTGIRVLLGLVMLLVFLAIAGAMVAWGLSQASGG
jgi:hypothetical protein